MAGEDLLGDGGGTGGDGGAPDFRSTLPEQFRDHTALQDIKSLEGLVSSYVNAQSMVGKDKIPLPGESATDEDWNNTFKALGRPDAPEGYGFDPKKLELPEGFTMNDDFNRDILKTAHDAGLTKRQADKMLKGLYGMFGGDFQRQSQEQKANREKWQNQLREDLGGAFDEQLSLANQAFKKIGGEELTTALKQAGLLSHPSLVKAFAKLGELTSEGNADVTDGGSGQFKMTAEQAKNEITQLRADAEFMKNYTDNKSPGHAAAMSRYTNLFKIAYPGTQQS